MRLMRYERPDNLSDAYELLSQHKNSVVIGGGAFLRLQNRNINLGIDLEGLALKYIKADDKQLIIGSMTTLRQLEKSDWTNESINGVLSQMVRQIGGVQLRNVATIGGSICGRYYFSDILPTLLVLEAKLNFFDSGIIKLKDYLKKPIKNDILKEIIIKKDQEAWMRHFKRTYKEFPLITVAVGKKDEHLKIAIGATPKTARVIELTVEDYDLNDVIEQFEFGDDFNASADYRKALAKTYIKEIMEGGQ